MIKGTFMVMIIGLSSHLYGQALVPSGKSASYVQLMWVFNGMQSDSGKLNKHDFLFVNNNVSPRDSNEQNIQTVNALYLKYFLAPVDTIWHNDTMMTNTDLATTYNIASKCYISGGPAVFLARSMYWAAVRDNSEQFDDNCTTGGSDQRMQRSQSQTVDTIKWVELSPLPDTIQRFVSAYFVIDSDLYVAGGQYSYQYIGVKTVWKYHIPSNTWSQKRDLPFGVASCGGSFALNGKGYFLVARDSMQTTNCSNAFWQYDAHADTWTRLADFPDSSRQNSVSFVYDGKGYVGETYGCGFSDGHFWSYDGILNQWSEIASLPPPIIGISAGVGTSVASYLIGGSDEGGNPHNNFWVYNTLGGMWNGLTPITGSGRANAVVWGLDSTIISGGGWTHDSNFSYQMLNDFYKYNMRANTWTPITFVNSFDSAAGGYSFVFNKRGYYFGGYNTFTYPTYSNRLWSFDASKYFADTTHVGIQNIVTDEYNFKVFPNPLDKQKTLNVQCSEDGEITFFDLLGRITNQGKIHKGLNSFDCLQLACDNRVILYRATMRSGRTESGKVIVLR